MRSARPSGNSTQPGERKGFAEGAEERSSRGFPDAALARRSKMAALPGRTPRVAGAIATGVPVGFVSTVVNTQA